MQDFTLVAETIIAQKLAAEEPLNLTRFVVANIPDLDPTLAVDREQTLPPAGQRVYEAAVYASGYVADNKVVYSLVMDTTVGDFNYNWIGLLDDTGETVDDANLIFVAELVYQRKFKTFGSQQGDNVTRNILMQFASASTVTGITVPAEAWQYDITINAGNDVSANKTNFLVPVLIPDGISSSSIGVGWSALYLSFPSAVGDTELTLKTVFNDPVWILTASDIHEDATHWFSFNLDSVDDLLYVTVANISTGTIWLATISRSNTPVVTVIGSLVLTNSSIVERDMWIGSITSSEKSCPSMTRPQEGGGAFTIRMNSREIIISDVDGSLIEDTKTETGGRLVTGRKGFLPLNENSTLTLSLTSYQAAYGSLVIGGSTFTSIPVQLGISILDAPEFASFQQMNGHYVIFTRHGRPSSLFYYSQETVNEWLSDIYSSLSLGNKIGMEF